MKKNELMNGGLMRWCLGGRRRQRLAERGRGRTGSHFLKKYIVLWRTLVRLSSPPRHRRDLRARHVGLAGGAAEPARSTALPQQGAAPRCHRADSLHQPQ